MVGKANVLLNEPAPRLVQSLSCKVRVSVCMYVCCVSVPPPGGGNKMPITQLKTMEALYILLLYEL